MLKSKASNDSSIKQDEEKDAFDLVYEACEKLKAKKDALYQKYLKIDSMDNISKMKFPTSNPFDIDAIDDAALNTGAPVTRKILSVIVNSFEVSSFRDDEFAGAIMTAISKLKPEIEKEKELEGELEEAHKERDRFLYPKKVAEAQGKLEGHRLKVTNLFIEPILKADTYRMDDIPYISRMNRGCRHIGIQSGRNVPVRSQAESLFYHIQANRRDVNSGTAYRNLKNLTGNHIPGVQKNVGIAAVTPSGEVYSPASTNGKRKSIFSIWRNK